MIGEADIEDVVKEERRKDDSQIDVTPPQIKTLGLKISAMDGEDSGIDVSEDTMIISRLVREKHRDSRLSPRVQSRYDFKGFNSPLQVQINVVLFNLILREAFI